MFKIRKRMTPKKKYRVRAVPNNVKKTNPRTPKWASADINQSYTK